jgi:hypothetical protein
VFVCPSLRPMDLARLIAQALASLNLSLLKSAFVNDAKPIMATMTNVGTRHTRFVVASLLGINLRAVTPMSN